MAGSSFTAMLVLLVALVSTVGVCVLDVHAGGHHGGSLALDLCIGMLGVSLVSGPLVVLAVMGRAVVPAYLGVTISALEVLELPPKR